MIEVRPADLGGLVDVTTSPAAVDSSTIWCSSRAPSSGTGRPLAERSAASNYRHPDPDFFVGLDVDLDVGQVFRARARARGQGPGAAELVGQHPAPLGNPQSRPGDLPGGGMVTGACRAKQSKTREARSERGRAAVRTSGHAVSASCDDAQESTTIGGIGADAGTHEGGGGRRNRWCIPGPSSL